MMRLGSALVAQLDRASGYGPEGRGFESSRARHSLPRMEFDADEVRLRPAATSRAAFGATASLGHEHPSPVLPDQQLEEPVRHQLVESQELPVGLHDAA